MSGKDLSKTVPTVPNKHAKGKRWGLPDTAKLYQLRVEQGLSFTEIGRPYGTTKQAWINKPKEVGLSNNIEVFGGVTLPVGGLDLQNGFHNCPISNDQH